MQADVTTTSSPEPKQRPPQRTDTMQPNSEMPEPTFMEGAVVLVFLAFLAVLGIVGTLLAH